MTIRDTAALRQHARTALENTPVHRRIAYVYTAVMVGLSLALTLADYVLTELISGTGGLGNMGTRTILSTLQSMLPILQTLVLLGWGAGYSISVLKIARGEYADADTLKSGFSLFFPLLRMMLLEGAIYFGLCMLSFYLSFQIYMFTPWALDLMEIMEPMLPSILNTAAPVIEEAAMIPMMKAMAPMLLIFAGFYFLLAIPMGYRLRMRTFCLIDNPAMGALRAIATSRRIMRRNCFQLFKLDLSFWWYHALLAIATAIQMLPMTDLIPLDFDLVFYLCYGVYLALISVVYVFLRNRVEVAYAAAYETLREKPAEPQNQVVLGNIFDM